MTAPASPERAEQGHTTSGLSVSRWAAAFPLVVLPLLLGGARPWLWSAVASICLAGVAALLWTKEGLPLLSSISRKWGILLALMLSYPVMQLIPLPDFLLSILSPHGMMWSRDAGEAAQLGDTMRALSYTPLTTFFSWLWWVFLAGYALFLRRVLGRGRDFTWLMRILFLIAGFEALHGLAQVLVPSMGTLRDSGGSGLARGTFVNRNHYAAFLGMIWPVLLAYTVSLRAGPSANPPLERRRKALEAGHKQVFLLLWVGFVLLAIVFSQSRGGILGALVAMTVLILLGGVRKGGAMVFLMACWLMVIGYAGIIGFDEILARFDSVESDASGRFRIWGDTWRLIQDHPWSGVGLGGYRTVIRLYQSHLGDSLQIGHAHNDYLELAAELGIPMAVALAALVWGYGVSCARKAAFWKYAAGRGGRHPGAEAVSEIQRRWLAVGALAGGAAFLLHSLVELNGQIPANQLYFTVLLVLMNQSALRS